MKRILFAALMLACFTGCAQPQEPRVMARFVPERSDDFVWENNLICYRCYGEALEHETLSPGFDVWVKLPGALVADQRYKDDLENHLSYHKDHGNGKDCYKVGKTLGAGASAIMIDGRLKMPGTNYRSWEILESAPDKVVFVLHYPEWKEGGATISLDKKITVTPDTYFCKCEDTYRFTGEYGDSLYVAAGVFRHPKQNTVEEELTLADRYAIWEHASDTKAEPEESMTGVAVCMPGADFVGYSHGDSHGICTKKVVSGETVTYWFGSCWSKGDLKTAAAWFDTVRAQ